MNSTYDAIGSLQTHFKRLGLHVKTEISLANDNNETHGYPRLTQYVQSLKKQLASDALRPQPALGLFLRLKGGVGWKEWIVLKMFVKICIEGVGVLKFRFSMHRHQAPDMTPFPPLYVKPRFVFRYIK